MYKYFLLENISTKIIFDKSFISVTLFSSWYKFTIERSCLELRYDSFSLMNWIRSEYLYLCKIHRAQGLPWFDFYNNMFLVEKESCFNLVDVSVPVQRLSEIFRRSLWWRRERERQRRFRKPFSGRGMLLGNVTRSCSRLISLITLSEKTLSL